MSAFISSITYELPEDILTNEMLSVEFPEWSVKKIEEKTGIKARRIASENECASDLGIRAAEHIFTSFPNLRNDIDYLLFCTQSPDYFLPTTACIIQEKLRISNKCGALDFNLGCSGYIYGLGLAKGLVETGQARNILLITADTYSKYINKNDKSVRTIFGDAATATLVQDSYIKEEIIGPFVYGTDGSGWKNLIVQNGGARYRQQNNLDYEKKSLSNDLYMNGSEILTFTLKSIPELVDNLLNKVQRKIDDINLFIFHQANEFILRQLQRKIKIPEEKFFIDLKYHGNTVSSSIPIAINNASSQGRLNNGDIVMIIGFGVGYSWGATIIKWIVK